MERSDMIQRKEDVRNGSNVYLPRSYTQANGDERYSTHALSRGSQSAFNTPPRTFFSPKKISHYSTLSPVSAPFL